MAAKPYQDKDLRENIHIRMTAKLSNKDTLMYIGKWDYWNNLITSE